MRPKVGGDEDRSPRNWGAEKVYICDGYGRSLPSLQEMKLYLETALRQLQLQLQSDFVGANEGAGGKCAAQGF